MKAPIAFAAFLLLGACGGSAGDNSGGAEAEPQTSSTGNDRIDCALAGAATFERQCTLEQASGKEGLVLIIRAPDGGFRRLLVTGDGRGVAAADGAESARVTPIDSASIEVAIGGDRYRLPATVRNSGG